MSRSNQWISASDVGRAAYCPQYLAYKYAGTEVDQSAVKARIAGEAAHQRLNQTANDKRCFVASWVYGPDHPNTNLLRTWRDKHLETTKFGKATVRVYYRLSPPAIAILNRVPGAKALARATVNLIVRILEREHA